jgi:hypothetical protein
MPGTTPDTTSYLLLGLTAAVVLYGGFILSMVIRRRSLEKDLDTLRQLEDEQPR